MIDFEDVEFVAIAGSPSGCGPVGAFLFVVFLVALFCVAMNNSNECAQRQCPNGGVPRLMNHSCLCVEEAR